MNESTHESIAYSERVTLRSRVSHDDMGVSYKLPGDSQPCAMSPIYDMGVLKTPIGDNQPSAMIPIPGSYPIRSLQRRCVFIAHIASIDW